MSKTGRRTSSADSAGLFRLRGGNALLRNLVENAAVPIFLADAQGGIIFANRAFGDLLGYAPEESLSLGIVNLVHPDDVDMVRRQFGGVATGHDSGYTAERRYLRKDGTAVWVLASAVRMLDAAGRTLYTSVQAVDIDRQKRAEAALAEIERRWSVALESAEQGVWESDIIANSMYYSRRWKQMRGFDPDASVDMPESEWLKRVHPDDVERVIETIRRQRAGESAREAFEFRERHEAGHYIWILTNGAPAAWAADGTPIRIVGADLDITQRKLAEQEKLELTRRLGLALDVSRVGIFEGNMATLELFWDDRLHDIYGIPRERKMLRAIDWEERLHPEDAAEAMAIMAHALAEKSSFNARFRIVRPDGEVRTVMSQGTYTEDEYATPKLVGVNWDITEDVALSERLKAAKELAEARNVELEAARARIEEQSLHDALTGLPNRRYLDRILNEHADRPPVNGPALALLHIDLDRFKQINDTLGHVAGDAMLVHVARLLSANAGAGNFVARVGGDEFIIICFKKTDNEHLAALANRLISKIRQPVPYEGHLCRFGASIGIAVASDGRIDAQRLLINGDIALYRAKGRGRNRYEFFSKALRQEIESTKRMADDILRGIEQHEFLPHYQPLFDANTLDVAGVEALVRWNHPTEGILGPAQFLKIAEDLNVLASIDGVMLSEATKDFAHWRALDLGISSVSVNVSVRRLTDDQLVPSIRALDIAPGTVSFELVESIFLDEFDDVVRWNIEAIREMGIGIDVDDFGTGHTSIVGLLKLSPQRFKIDRQLIAPIASTPEQRRLVASIIDIGKTLGIKVVAEGVETMEQARILTDLGCDLLQGYAFARPMPSAELAHWIGAAKWRSAS